MDFSFPPEKQVRVIVNTDAKNEADDQFAIVHALLTPSFDIRGIIPAHFGTRTPHSLQASHDEVNLLLKMMAWNTVRVEPGAPTALPDEKTPVPSPGAHLIIEEALSDDTRPLYVAFYGPLTDMASALLMEPGIAHRPNLRVVWIGGGTWPTGGPEYNLSNDIHAANVVFKSQLAVWQIPDTVYKLVAVGYAELFEKVHKEGAVGRYLVEQLVEWNAGEHGGKTAKEYRSLGDSPAVGVILYPDGGRWTHRPAPQFEPNMYYRHTGQNRPIRVYETFDARFLMEDFFAKLARFARSGTVG